MDGCLSGRHSLRARIRQIERGDGSFLAHCFHTAYTFERTVPTLLTQSIATLLSRSAHIDSSMCTRCSRLVHVDLSPCGIEMDAWILIVPGVTHSLSCSLGAQRMWPLCWMPSGIKISGRWGQSIRRCVHQGRAVIPACGQGPALSPRRSRIYDGAARRLASSGLKRGSARKDHEAHDLLAFHRA